MFLPSLRLEVLSHLFSGGAQSLYPKKHLKWFFNSQRSGLLLSASGTPSTPQPLCLDFTRTLDKHDFSRELLEQGSG